ncbi:trimeric intracellular cation channel family protein [Thauera sp. CAU 1555]|uniref:Trimeric intracellular cation channel family protein n=1 Tax=Thauera sedimentorum TaxID=2767595 RepID=A0ABR9B6I8_9RHOO|nr:trimeric intracellular cation channel family protein [Thauera sedimentorum]MBC9071072.1 trimeric intracellular cation channel family protein [Thauera sedimentorum]MBD8501991.1 trimeric intracellular cation channel family protein [Thauera sedimentorum]
MSHSIAQFFQSFSLPQLDLLLLVYLIAISTEAMSGALAAGRRNMDIFGVAVIAFVTALGGGTIRDVVLGNYPIGWTQHPEYVYLVILAGLATTVLARFMHHMKRSFLMLDAMGLVAFSLIGCDVALRFDYPVVVVIMAGMLTGISGGILRDVLCNQVPVVFRRELYASVSLFVCVLFLGLRSAGVDDGLNMLSCFVLGFGFRMLALRQSWRLPTFSYQQRWE